jgi:hypothetical protein
MHDTYEDERDSRSGPSIIKRIASRLTPRRERARTQAARVEARLDRIVRVNR